MNKVFVYGGGLDEVLRVTQQDFADVNGDALTTDYVDLYFHENSIGSIVALTRDTGVVVEAYRYDAYGALEEVRDKNGATVTSLIPPTKNAILWQGRQLDSEEASGLYYFRARQYDPKIGRFISRDPKGVWGDAGQLGNGQSAFSADPLNRVDPFGRDDEPKDPEAEKWEREQTEAFDKFARDTYAKIKETAAFKRFKGGRTIPKFDPTTDAPPNDEWGQCELAYDEVGKDKWKVSVTRLRIFLKHPDAFKEFTEARGKILGKSLKKFERAFILLLLHEAAHAGLPKDCAPTDDDELNEHKEMQKPGQYLKEFEEELEKELKKAGSGKKGVIGELKELGLADKDGLEAIQEFNKNSASQIKDAEAAKQNK